VAEEARLNPFTPDRPAPPPMFAGRRAEVRQIREALTATLAGRARHILIVGERWIGKSSTAVYAKNMADMAEFAFDDPDISVHASFVSLGKCQTINEVCVAILDSLKECQNTVRHKIFDILSSISGLQIGMLGVTVDRKAEGDFLVPTFPSVFQKVLDQTKSAYDAVMIILDETEQVSRLAGISSFLKTFLEELQAAGYGNFILLMTATPEGVHSFTCDHPSFPRLFRYVDLESLSQEDSRDLLEKALAEGIPRVTVSDTAAELMFGFSEGLPGLLQELGFWAFEVNTDGEIKRDDVVRGIVGLRHIGIKGALDTLYDKHFRKTLHEDLLSERYREILYALASSETEVVSRSYLRSQLPQWEVRGMDRYLSILRDRGIVEFAPVGKRGEYRFTSRMLSLWVDLDQMRKEREAKEGQ